MILLDPAFRTPLAGFKNFRGLLGVAQDRGLVEVHKPPGATDVVITLRGQQHLPPAPKDRAPSPSGFLGGWLRRDLWAALNDWSGTQYVYDMSTHATTPVPADPGFEPGPMQRLVPVVRPDEQQDWMRDFVGATSEPDVRSQLEAAMSGEAPLERFRTAVYAHHQVRRRWAGMLRSRLMDRAKEWAHQSGVDYASLLNETGAAPSSRQRDGQGMSGAVGSPDEDLRRRVLEVLEGLPLSELLRLPVPLEHVLRR